MDMDSSFGDFTDGNRFIALVVSDNEDDYDSSTEEEEQGEREEMITPRVHDSPSLMNKKSGTNSLSSSKLSSVIRSPTTAKSKSEDKKRWSFISNHSSTSSNNAKKRWSTLSSFTDSKDKDSTQKETKDKEKFLRRVSTQGSSSVSSHRKISIDQHEHTPLSIKRSSTGSSLKQLFGLIALNDENKENQYFQHHKKQDNFKVPTTIPTRIQPLKERRNTNTEPFPRQRHSVILGKNDSHRRQSTNSSSHQHSPSISSLASITSGSKWKFWHRGRDRSVSRSASTQSLVVQPTDPTMRTKSSFSELHKSMYAANTNGSFVEDNNSSIISNSLSKRLSSSNLSLGNLKHRSSQSSLKHKSSQSSLQRFKTRRKSNNMTEEGSISSSSSHPPKISLPVVDQMSRDKIKTKLRDSTSLLSLNSSLPIMVKDYDEVILQQILNYCDVREELPPDDEYIPPLQNSVLLSTHVWRADSDGTTVVYKKLPLGTLEDVTYSKSMCLHELRMLRLCKGTTGLPYLLRSFVIRERTIDENVEAEDKLFLLIILRDSGAPLKGIKLTTWSQALKIFWQVVTTLYVAETKFEFEHRNLCLDHILVDANLNVTLCDLKCSRAYWSSMGEVLYTRLDHPLFFQGGGDYQFDVYNLMRAILSESSWDGHEPRTNLLWLHFLLIKILQKNDGKLIHHGREKLAAMAQLLDPCSTAKRSIFKRNEIEVKSCGDLLRFK